MLVDTSLDNATTTHRFSSLGRVADVNDFVALVLHLTAGSKGLGAALLGRGQLLHCVFQVARGNRGRLGGQILAEPALALGVIFDGGAFLSRAVERVHLGFACIDRRLIDGGGLLGAGLVDVVFAFGQRFGHGLHQGGAWGGNL